MQLAIEWKMKVPLKLYQSYPYLEMCVYQCSNDKIKQMNRIAIRHLHLLSEFVEIH